MFLRAILIIHLTVVLFGPGMAQECTYEIKGRVVDESARPIAGAAVFLQPVQRGVAADSTGTFVFGDLCKGKYKVVVQFLGFNPMEREVYVEERKVVVITLKEDVTQLREVEIQDEILQTEHAHNYAKLNEQQLSNTAGKSLGESLREIAGVNSIQSGPGIFKPVIHGVHSQRVLILNHGIRQEGQQWGAEHAPEVDPFIASEIVVIKDASSIKYGTDALGGVIVVNPPVLPERNILGGTLQTVYQSNGRSGTIAGMLEGGIKNLEGWGWRVQGTAKKAGDFNTPEYNLTNTGIKELNFSAATGYHHEDFGLEIFASRFQTTLGILKGAAISNVEDLANAMKREPPQYTASFSYDIDEPRQQVSHNLIKLNGHLKVKTGTWRMQYGFQNNNRQEYDIRKGTRSETPAIDLQLNTHSLETEFETTTSASRTLCVGLTGMLQQNTNIPGTQRIPFIPNFAGSSAGTYAVAKFFFEKAILDLGARYDFRVYDVKGFDFKNELYKKTLEFHNASATAGLTLKTSATSAFSTNLSTAWRPPHVAELYSIGTHQSAGAIEYGLLLDRTSNEVMNIEQTTVRPEQAVKFVNSFQQSWKKTGIELTAYANYIFDYIFLRPEGVTTNIRGVFPYFRYRQTDALFLGADLSGSWQVTSLLKVATKATLLRASDERNDDLLVFIPPNRYEMSFHIDKPDMLFFKRFYVESRLRYTAEQKRAPRTITVNEINDINTGGSPFESKSNFDFMNAPEAYWLVNLSGGFSIPADNVRLDFRASAENLLNTSYREYSNRFRYYADEIGRNFIISVKAIF